MARILKTAVLVILTLFSYRLFASPQVPDYIIYKKVPKSHAFSLKKLSGSGGKTLTALIVRIDTWEPISEEIYIKIWFEKGRIYNWTD